MQDMIGRIAPRPVFLIWATHGVDTEVLNAEYFKAAGEPKTLWEIPDARHVGGLAARPAEYERRVVGVLRPGATRRPAAGSLAQQRDQLARVVDDEVGAEFDRGLARDARSRTGRRRRRTASGAARRVRRAPRRRRRARPRSRSRAPPGRAARTRPAPPGRRGRARPEQQRLPAVGLEEVGDHPRAEHVLLLGRAGDDREPPVARRARQLAAERVEDRLRDRRGVVLLGDVQRAHRPPVPDLAQRGLEHAEVDVRHRCAARPAPPRPRAGHAPSRGAGARRGTRRGDLRGAPGSGCQADALTLHQGLSTV